MTEHIAVYLDMDGVLVDFDKAATQKLPPGQFELTNMAFHDKSKNTPEIKQMHHNLCMSVKDHENFWSELDWMHDGQHLFEFVKSNFRPANIGVLTAPLRYDDNCCKDKWVWVQKHLKIIDKRNYYCVQDKWEYIGKISAPYQILIDDKHENIRKWRENGGIGIWHKTAKDSIYQLKEVMENFSDFVRHS